MSVSVEAEEIESFSVIGRSRKGSRKKKRECEREEERKLSLHVR